MQVYVQIETCQAKTKLNYDEQTKCMDESFAKQIDKLRLKRN